MSTPSVAAPLPGAAAVAGTVADQQAHRRARIVAVAALVVLNLADLATTYTFLAAGFPEGNPIAAVLIDAGWIGWVKGALLLALGARALWGRPRLVTTCALWFVVGVYVAVVAVNTAIVAGL